MRPARVLLLVVAILAGGLAAYLATRGSGPAPTRVVTEVRQEQKSRVLVASQPIGVGQRINPALVEWQDWPEGAVRPEYITVDRLPDAPEELAGTVARFEIFTGEPIRESKLVRADQGYLSAVIAQGMRAVSVNVTAASGAGGFIVPNDRVDVVLTRQVNGFDVSETVLSNVKILAIGLRLGETGKTGAAESEDPQSQVFQDNTIATLELTPAQAEVVLSAQSAGSISLVLRSIADFTEQAGAARRNSQTVRMIRFGTETSVMSGSMSGGEAGGGAVSEPAAYQPPAPVFDPSASGMQATPSAPTPPPPPAVQ